MQNMKHKLTFIVSLGIALILTAVIGATVSLHHCMKWDAYCDNGTLPLSTVKFTQNLIFHAYYWMGIAFICLCLVVAMLIWYFRHQQKLHPELSDMIADTSECEFKKIRVNRYTNEITIDGTTQAAAKWRPYWIISLKLPHTKSHSRNSIPYSMRISSTVRRHPNGK